MIWPFTKKRDPLKLVNHSSFNLDIEQWRSNTYLVSEADKLAALPVFRAMMAVMKNESPSALVMPIGTQMLDRVALQCRIEGYHMALNNIEAMAKPADLPDEPIESTFEKINKVETEE